MELPCPANSGNSTTRLACLHPAREGQHAAAEHKCFEVHRLTDLGTWRSPRPKRANQWSFRFQQKAEAPLVLAACLHLARAPPKLLNGICHNGRVKFAPSQILNINFAAERLVAHFAAARLVKNLP